MFSEPSSAAVAGIQAIFVAIPLLGLGYLIADLFLGARLGRVACLGLSLPGLVTYSLILMLLHIVTGGDVFSNLVLVRVVTLAVLIALGTRLALVRRKRKDPDGNDTRLQLAVALVALVVWCIPIFVMTPLNFGADTRLHMGWASQLLNGETTPTAGITGDIPNYYPWLFHALIALVTAVTPGSDPFTAQAPLQLIQVAGISLALFALGMEMTRNARGALGATLFGALTGGFGWVIARGPAIVFDTRHETLDYGGDLIPRRSPNMALHDLVPVYPREIGFTLVVAMLLALIAALRRANLNLYAVAGVVLGLTGLTGGEAFIYGGVVALVVSLLPGPGTRLRRLGAVFVPGIALAALWYVPLIANYVELGGFVDSAFPPVELPASGFLVAFGITVPFALYGFLHTRRNADPGVWMAFVVLAAAIALLLVAGQVPRIFGEGFTTLGRQHRYWPLVYLGLTVFAAFGFAAAWRWLGERRKWFVPVLVLGSVALAVPSPILGSIGATQDLAPPDVFTGAVTGDAANLLNVIAPEPGMRCTIAVPDELSVITFAYTGYRHVVHALQPRPGNRARIRWADIYEQVPGDGRRRRANELLTLGLDPARWEAVAEGYGVDIVVAPASQANQTAFAPYEKRLAYAGPGQWLVVWRDSCDGDAAALVQRASPRPSKPAYSRPPNGNLVDNLQASSWLNRSR